MTTNTTTINRIFDEVFNGGDADVFAELAAEDLVVHYGPGTSVEGLAAFHEAFAADRANYADQQFVIDDLLADGDRVVVRWRWDGRQDGRTVSTTGLSLYRLVDGRVVEAWVESAEPS